VGDRWVGVCAVTVAGVVQPASAQVMSQRNLMAARARDDLAAAGLPIAAEGVDPVVRHAGAFVEAETHTGGSAPVIVRWQVGTALHNDFAPYAIDIPEVPRTSVWWPPQE
jgi:hypothetical protein